MNFPKRMMTIITWILFRHKTIEFLFNILIFCKHHVPEEQWIAFLKVMLRNHISDLLEGISHEKRAELMNFALPILANEFPLIDLDIHSAFSTTNENLPHNVFESP